MSEAPPPQRTSPPISQSLATAILLVMGTFWGLQFAMLKLAVGERYSDLAILTLSLSLLSIIFPRRPHRAPRALCRHEGQGGLPSDHQRAGLHRALVGGAICGCTHSGRHPHVARLTLAHRHGGPRLGVAHRGGVGPAHSCGAAGLGGCVPCVVAGGGAAGVRQDALDPDRPGDAPVLWRGIHLHRQILAQGPHPASGGDRGKR